MRIDLLNLKIKKNNRSEEGWAPPPKASNGCARLNIHYMYIIQPPLGYGNAGFATKNTVRIC